MRNVAVSAPQHTPPTPVPRYTGEFRFNRRARAWAERKSRWQYENRKARHSIYIPADMLHDFLAIMGFERVLHDRVLSREGYQELYAAVVGSNRVLKVYSSVPPHHNAAREAGIDSIRISLVGLNTDGTDNDQEARGISWTNRVPGWPEKLFNKIADLVGSTAPRLDVLSEIRREKSRSR